MVKLIYSPSQLNGGTLDGASLTVTSDVPDVEEPPREGSPLDQSDKPRAGSKLGI
jgi:hypothetical protein